MERDIHQSRTLEIAMADIPVSAAGGTALGEEVLAVCNEHLTANGATSVHTFNRDVTTSFSANTARSVRLNPSEVIDPEDEFDFNGGDETRHASFGVQVRCNPYVQDAFFVPAPVEDIELFLATFSNAVTHPDVFRTCKQGRILVRVTTEWAGPVAFDLWTDLDGFIERESIQTWSSDVGSGVYEAEVQRWVSVSETTGLSAMAVVDYTGLNTGWESLTLQCETGADDLVGRRPLEGRH
jgi:hypothetical protein